MLTFSCSGDYTTTKIVHNDTYPAIDPLNADHTGHAIFVAGASRGIGRAIAIAFAKGGASHIAIGARSDLSAVVEAISKAATAAGRQAPQVLALKLDIIDASSVEAAAKRIEQDFGKLDVVVNNAGILGAMTPMGDGDPATWWSVMECNVRGPYHVSHYCIPLLLKGKMKTLISVASVGAHLTMPTASAYQTSKLAGVRLMEFASADYQEQGLIAFSVHPGNSLTDIVGHGEGYSEAFKAVFTETTELCADSLVYLTNERRQWLSGRYVNCTWDLPELMGEKKRKEIIEQDKLKVRLVL